MELDYCACGKKCLNFDSYYCSEKCRMADDDNVQYSHHSQSVVVNPPQNLHFSITIPPNLFKASDSNSGASSGSSFNSNLSSSFTSGCYDHEDYNYVYNSHYDESNKYNDDDDATAYLSRSIPINIPSSRARTPSCDPELEINKGTFGQDKSGF